MTVIDFTANLRLRSIEQIPVIYARREYRCTIDRREVEVFQGPEDGKWHWRIADYPWHHPLFEDSIPRQFDTAAEAHHNAIETLGRAA